VSALTLTRQVAVAAVVALTLTACEAAEQTSGESQATTTTGSETKKPRMFAVARVIDGDTIDLDNGDRVRLVQIDAPESKGECYKRAATRLLRKLLPEGTTVRLRADRALDKRDRYGRLLRYVFRGKKNINLVLVQKGAASAYFFHGDRGRYAARFAAVATEARDRGRGGWGACVASFDFSRAWRLGQKGKTTIDTITSTTTEIRCHPSYEGACLDPNSSDYDCAGGEGNGPDYTGPVRVVGPDDYGLDADGDGIGCEDS
jgi:endonuclease YncB( thermonuclease family)